MLLLKANSGFDAHGINVRCESHKVEMTFLKGYRSVSNQGGSGEQSIRGRKQVCSFCDVEW